VAGLALIEASCAGPGAASWLEDILNTLTITALSLEFCETADRLRKAGRRKLARMATAADALLNGTSIIDDLSAERPLEASELARISCPVLGVYGQESELAGGARDLVARVPDCRIEIMPGLAHTVLREATAPLRDLLLAWLPSPGASSSGAASPDPASTPGAPSSGTASSPEASPSGTSSPNPASSPDAPSPGASPSGPSLGAPSPGAATSPRASSPVAPSPGTVTLPGPLPGEAA
jgi:hypothetical protein